MHAWLCSPSKEGEHARGASGGDYPPLDTGGAVLAALYALGWSMAGGMGPVGISASELTAWANGTMADLGPRDFQDVLTVSRVFVGAIGDYSGKPMPAPWVPGLTEAEEAEILAAQKRHMDSVMGIEG